MTRYAKAKRKGNRLYITKRYDNQIIGISKPIKRKEPRFRDGDVWEIQELLDESKQRGMKP